MIFSFPKIQAFYYDENWEWMVLVSNTGVKLQLLTFVLKKPPEGTGDYISTK